MGLLREFELLEDIAAYRQENERLHSEIERLREALNEMLDESMDGIAICPLTKIKARNALGRKP